MNIIFIWMLAHSAHVPRPRGTSIAWADWLDISEPRGTRTYLQFETWVRLMLGERGGGLAERVIQDVMVLSHITSCGVWMNGDLTASLDCV